MKIHPIIPIWIMSILCIGMICLKRKGIWNYIRQILIVVLLFAMNLRIMVYSNDVEKRQLDIDVLFVIDNSMSMLAEDYNGDGRRIDAVKSDCEYIMDKLTGARFSVIEFGNYANRLAPYTSDITAIQTAINSLEGQTQYYATGTSLNLPYETVKEVLEKNRENNPDRTQVLFFFSDGEITTKNEKLDSYASAADYIDGGAVLGYGTTEGGRMKVHSYEGDYGNPFYMQTRDKSGRLVDAISYIDESNLKQIAKDLELNYYLAENQDAVRDMIIDLTNYLNEMATSEHLGDEGYSETYYWFAIPMVGLLIYDLIYYKRRLRG